MDENLERLKVYIRLRDHVSYGLCLIDTVEKDSELLEILEKRDYPEGFLRNYKYELNLLANRILSQL